MMMMMMMMTTRHSGKVLQHEASPKTKETRTCGRKESRLTLDAHLSKKLFTNVGISSPDRDDDDDDKQSGSCST